MKRLAVFILLLALGCDTQDALPPAPSTQRQQTTTLEITTLNRLEANRAIQLAVGGDGAIWWTQRSEGSRETVFCQERTGLPRATSLTSQAILSRLGYPTGDGRIAAMIGVEGGCVFYFVGGSGIEPIATLARFDRRSGEITILADYTQLSQVTGLGRTIELAEASLVLREKRAVLWLWLADGSQFLDVPIASNDAPPTVAFTTLYLNGLPIELKPQAHRISSGWNSDRILLTQLQSKDVLSVDRTGMCERIAQITLPIGAPTNVAATANGRLAIFLAQGRSRGAAIDDTLDPTLPALPAMVSLTGGATTVVPLGQIAAHQGFPTYALQLQTLIADPTQPNEFVSFDLTSGELVRLTLRD